MLYLYFNDTTRRYSPEPFILAAVEAEVSQTVGLRLAFVLMTMNLRTP